MHRSPMWVIPAWDFLLIDILLNIRITCIFFLSASVSHHVSLSITAIMPSTWASASMRPWNE